MNTDFNEVMSKRTDEELVKIVTINTIVIKNDKENDHYPPFF